MAKSFSPAGMAVKAYYGRGARTFGNPDGAVTGGGAYAAGGANPNGPNQGGGGGGGGQAVTFNYVTSATNSSGPYDVPNNTSLISGVTRPPIPSLVGVAPLGVINPDPVLVNGVGLQVVGTVGVGPIWYWTICLDSAVSQIFFTDWTFTTVGGPTRTLRAADADFNNLFATPGFSIWAWPMPCTGLPADFINDGTDVTINWAPQTLTIQAATSTGTGYEQTFCGVPVFGTKISGALPIGTSGNPFAIGDGVANQGPPGFSIESFGAFNQSNFNSVQIVGGPTYTTATATFFTNGGGCGPSTIWTWPLAGLVAGHTYEFIFS